MIFLNHRIGKEIIMSQTRDVVDDAKLDKKVFEALLRYGNQSAVLLSIVVGEGITEILLTLKRLALKRLRGRKAIRWAKTFQVLPAPKDRVWTAY